MGSIMFQDSYAKLEPDSLLTNKVSIIGNVSLPGHLGIGTTYTSSRIRCDAEVNGYVGYAELNAASSYDMFLNLSTTKADSGWMHFIINNGDYMQLSSSGNKVNVYKDTAISGNWDVGVGASRTSIKAYVNHAGHQGNIQIEPRWNSQGYVNFNTANPDGLLLIATKDVLYMCCGLNIIRFYKPTKMLQMIGFKQRGYRTCM